jgi:hypothetical protein
MKKDSYGMTASFFYLNSYTLGYISEFLERRWPAIFDFYTGAV